ncbi:glycosyltransferase family 4 protein [Halobacteriovorax sp. RZ-3]|uniref:glycosyltransferase family 4 protein n=1 Tax=Halobacteriovorax sp. RZ-3 TaxID=3157720 RepID=UPI00371B8583
MKKVLIYSQWFDPEPTPRGLSFAKELIRIGYDVEVLTGVPNYPYGKIYEGYKNKYFQKEIVDGITIKRVYLFPSHDSSKLNRVWNYVSFALSSFIYLLFFQKRVDMIYVYHPPLTLGLNALIVRFLRNIPFVYDIQDMWPDTLRATGMLNNEKILNFIGLLASYIYRFAFNIVVISEGFKNLLVGRGVSADKITVIPNWCDEAAINNNIDMKIKLPGNCEFKILFAGNIGKAQNLDVILEAAKSFKEKIDFVFLGHGVEKERLLQKTLKENISNAHFLGSVPMDEVGGYLNSATALLVFLRDDDLFKITIPSKTQAYMCIGKPVIMGVSGDASTIIRESKGGICLSQNSVEDIVNQLESFSSYNRTELELMGNSAKEYYLSNLSLEVGVRKFSEIFKSS